MSNAPEGRTYANYRRDVRDGAEPYFNPNIMQWMYDKDDVIETITHFTVPNGQWVMERPHGYASVQLVGVSFNELTDHVYRDRDNTSRSLYACDKPFGYVCIEDDDVDRSTYPYVVNPAGRRTLHYARQIHNGELGHSVPIPTLNYVRQPFGEGEKTSVTKAHQRRRGYGWVKLAHLGEMAVGYSPDRWVELILDYWQFAGHLQYDDAGHRTGTLVDTARGSSLDIQLNKAEFVSMTPEQIRKDVGKDSSKLWVRRGLAFTILRLQVLGVQPSLLQHA